MSTVYFRLAARGALVRNRAPALERLLARADAGTRAADWRTEAFRVITAGSPIMPSAAAAALRSAGGGSDGAWVFVATPVHFVAGMSSVGMPCEGLLDLGEAEADALAVDFNRRFSAGGARLIRGAEALLLCVFDDRLDVTTTAPEQLTPRDIWDALPSGPDSGRVRRLMSEIEMWLFDHPVNRDRRSRGSSADQRPVAVGRWRGRRTDAGGAGLDRRGGSRVCLICATRTISGSSRRGCRGDCALARLSRMARDRGSVADTRVRPLEVGRLAADRIVGSRSRHQLAGAIAQTLLAAGQTLVGSSGRGRDLR